LQKPPICLHLTAKWTAIRSRICSSISRGRSGNVKNQTVKKLIYGERFHYTYSRGRDVVSDVIWEIKLRGVFWTSIGLLGRLHRLADRTDGPIKASREGAAARNCLLRNSVNDPVIWAHATRPSESCFLWLAYLGPPRCALARVPRVDVRRPVQEAHDRMQGYSAAASQRLSNRVDISCVSPGDITTTDQSLNWK
jgi:hypothetical protein